MADVTMTTKYDFGRVTEGSNKRLTYTSWNDGEYKFDIRDWYDNGNVGKGITLTKTELKNLYDLLAKIYDTNDFDAMLEAFVNEEESKTYPENIQKIFDELDTLFKGFKTEKDYGIMPFALESGDRLQYSVTKEKKKFPDYEQKLEELGVRSFITNKGNLYIYTL